MSEIPIPEPTPGPARSEPGFLNRLQTVLTLVIALAAIGLAIWEGAENRRHNRLSVLPRLGAEINSGHEGGSEYIRMGVESTGLGPAVIKRFRIYLDGVPQDTVGPAGSSPWQRVIEVFAAEGTSINAHAFGSGYFFPAGRQHVLFEVRRPDAAAVAGERLSDSLGRVALQVCYCSIYDTDCDEVLLTTGRLTPLSCTK